MAAAGNAFTGKGDISAPSATTSATSPKSFRHLPPPQCFPHRTCYTSSPHDYDDNDDDDDDCDGDGEGDDDGDGGDDDDNGGDDESGSYGTTFRRLFRHSSKKLPPPSATFGPNL